LCHGFSHPGERKREKGKKKKKKTEKNALPVGEPAAVLVSAGTGISLAFMCNKKQL
jgi:hypothetical protein